ncbi:MAG: DUF4956 domain-containing protein [Lachnospiraceae bacterium]
MTFKDAIKESFFEGFYNSDLTITKILITLAITFLISFYIFAVYRLITKNAFYSKNFNISMAVISIVTAGIILAMQSSLVISLGMVGALSIVRFRTAIKEPMDLLFLFWSIGSGIICGAGLFEIGFVLAAGVTVAIVVLQLIPEGRASKILFISSADKEIEKELQEPLKKNAQYYKVKSRNITGAGIEIVYEVKSKNDAELVASVSSIHKINTVSLISHDGEFRG